MKHNTMELVSQAHYIIDRTSFQVAAVRAGGNLGSLLTGGMSHVIGDGMGVALQAVLLNELCSHFGRPIPSASAMGSCFASNLPDLVTNFALDSGLGSFIPILGIPFCVGSGRNLTWRVGAFVTALCLVPENRQSEVVLETIAKQIIAFYPRNAFLLTLAAPSKVEFLELMDRIDAEHNPDGKATYTVISPKPEVYDLAAEVLPNQSSEESAQDTVDFGDIDENAEWRAEARWQGASEQLPFSLDEEDASTTPVAVIPEALAPYWNDSHSASHTVRESANDATEGVELELGEEAESRQQTESTESESTTTKRKHVKTGNKPTGRPKTAKK